MDQSTKGKTRVFVYGTLKRGYGNNSLLSKSEFIGADTLKGYKMMSKGAFPAIFKTLDEYFRVYGEVYEVDDSTLEILDYLEGVPNHYRRVTAETVSGRVVEVYVQDEPKERYKMVTGGTWMGSSNTQCYDAFPSTFGHYPPTRTPGGAEIVVYKAPPAKVEVGVDPVYAGLFDKPEANYVEPTEEKTAVKS